MSGNCKYELIMYASECILNSLGKIIMRDMDAYEYKLLQQCFLGITSITK